MKAISLWQPWASLVAIGAKKIETRGWSTSYRGPLAIHAAKHWTKDLGSMCLKEPFYSRLAAVGFCGITRRLCGLPLGAVVATCRLARVEPIYDFPQTIVGNEFVGTPERDFGDYREGRFGWVLEDVRQLPTPVPYAGSQGFFDVPDALLVEEAEVRP